jgi:hypothetical protein
LNIASINISRERPSRPHARTKTRDLDTAKNDKDERSNHQDDAYTDEKAIGDLDKNRGPLAGGLSQSCSPRLTTRSPLIPTPSISELCSMVKTLSKTRTAEQTQLTTPPNSAKKHKQELGSVPPSGTSIEPSSQTESIEKILDHVIKTRDHVQKRSLEMLEFKMEISERLENCENKIQDQRDLISNLQRDVLDLRRVNSNLRSQISASQGVSSGSRKRKRAVLFDDESETCF